MRISAKKPPLFTTDVFSTKSFGPGHVVGALIAVFGTYAIARAFVAHGQARSAAARAELDAARTGRGRGQYGAP